MKLALNKDREELFIKTAIWNSIIEIYKLEKGIDISEYLISVKIRNNIIIVKTNNPLINWELLNHNDKIVKSFKNKIKNLETKVLDFEIVYK